MPRTPTRLRKQREQDTAEDAMANMVAKSGSKKRNPTGIAKYVRETKAMMDADDWTGAKASHLVAMYCILHGMVYGVPPELKGDELKLAKMTAGTFLKTRCDGDFEVAVVYMKWVWKRERSREQWRVENQIDGKVLGWRLILKTASMWTEYRIGQERRKHG